MKNVTHALLLTVFLATSAAQAVLLKETASEQLFEKKPLLKNAIVMEDDKTEVTMLPVSHGLRKKTAFGLVTVDVYVMQLLAANSSKIVKDEAQFLNSLTEAGPVHLHLTFMRDLSGDKISDSFKDGLKANGVDTANLNKEMAQILKEVSGIKEFKENKTFSITLSWAGDNASVYLTAPDKAIVTVTGPKEFAHQLLSIWLGKPADSRLGDLKKALMK